VGQELSTIEELVEFHALDTISLTSAEGLHVANLTLRALAGMAEWEDLIRQQTFTTEITTNDLCSSDLSVLDTKIDTAIDAASNLTQLKTVLKTGLKKIVRCTRARAR